MVMTNYQSVPYNTFTINAIRSFLFRHDLLSVVLVVKLLKMKSPVKAKAKQETTKAFISTHHILYFYFLLMPCKSSNILVNSTILSLIISRVNVSLFSLSKLLSNSSISRSFIHFSIDFKV